MKRPPRWLNELGVVGRERGGGGGLGGVMRDDVVFVPQVGHFEVMLDS